MLYRTLNFDSVLEAVPDALVGLDQSGLIQFVNHQTELLFGYDRDEMVGQHINRLVSESLWQIYLAHRENYFADPMSRSMGLELELSGRHRDGGSLPVSISLSRVDTGDVLLVMTEAREAAKKAQEFERAQRMTAIIEHSNDAIIGTTLGGTITSWNPAAERMYGHSGKEIIGQSSELLEPGNRTGEISAILNRIRMGESVEHYETVRVRKDGTARAVSISISPIRNQKGVIVGACAITRDMTERINAFEASRAMIESTQDSLVTISPEGRITDANEATVQVTGIPSEQLIGTDFSTYFTDPELANEVYQKVFSQGHAVDYPMTIRHQNGTLTEVIYNASVHRGSLGNVVGVFAAARDVNRLTRAFQAQRHDRVKPRLAGLDQPRRDHHRRQRGHRQDYGCPP